MMIDGACKFETGTNVENLCVHEQRCVVNNQKNVMKRKKRESKLWQCNDDYWFMPQD